MSPGAFEVIIIILKILLFIIIAGMFCSLYQVMIAERLLKKSIENAYGELHRQNEVRMQETGVRRLLYGETDKRELFASIAALLTYSGAQGRLPWINPFFYGTGTACLALSGLAAGWTLTGKAGYGAACMAAAAALPYGLLVLLKEQNYRRTEKDIVAFMNLIENFSFSSDDLLEVVERAGQMVGDPVRRETAAAVLQARRSGDPHQAFRRLQDNIEYPHFKRLAANLERCSMGTADYQGIIEGSRKTVERNLSHDKEVRQLHQNGRGEILLMLGMGIFLIPFMGSVNGSGENTLRVLSEALAGRCILAFLLISAAAALWFCAFGAGRRR